MNNVTAADNVAELTVKRPPKTKTRSVDGEFREMLSDALKSAKQTAATQSSKTDENVKTNTKPAKNQQRQAKTAQADDTQSEAAAVNANAAMANPAAQAAQTAESDKPTEVQAVQIVQPEQAPQTAPQPEAQQAQELQAPAAETAVEAVETAEAVPAAAQARQAETTAAQAGVPEQPASQAQQAEAAKTAEANSSAEARNQTVAGGSDVEIVSAGVTAEAAETQAAHSNPRHIVQNDENQSRFDEMLAKAAQALGQGKTEQAGPDNPAETAEATVVPTDAGDATAPEAAIETPAENLTDLHTEPGTETKKQPQAAAVRSEAAPRFEQRPLKEIPKTDEAALGMAGQKNPDVRAAEEVRNEPQTFTRPVEVPEQAGQIRAQVIENLEKEKMEFNMQLHPQELGKVDVRMVLENGSLSVEIMAASQKSAELLSRQAEGLIASLKLGGIDVSSVNIVEASQNASANMDSQYNLSNFQNQADARENGNLSGNNQRRGGNPENLDAVPDEASDTPQRLLNYSV